MLVDTLLDAMLIELIILVLVSISRFKVATYYIIILSNYLSIGNSFNELKHHKHIHNNFWIGCDIYQVEDLTTSP